MRNESSWASISNTSDYDFYTKAENLNKRRFFYFITFIPFPILAVILELLYHINYNLGNITRSIYIPFCILSSIGIICLIIATGKLTRLRNNFIYRILSKKFSSVDLSPLLSISDSLLRETNLYKWDYVTRDNFCFRAKDWDTSFIFSNVTLRKWKNNISMGVFKGQWLIIDLETYYEPRVIKGDSFDYLCITGNRAHIVKKNKNNLFTYNSFELSELKKTIQEDAYFIKELLNEYWDIMKTMQVNNEQ